MYRLMGKEITGKVQVVTSSTGAIVDSPMRARLWRSATRLHMEGWVTDIMR